MQNKIIKEIESNDFLKACGNKLVTRLGKEVLLNGTNLGGWLLQESWMCPIDKEDRGWGNWDTLYAFQKRGFTKDQIQNLVKTYEDNWITEKDLDKIAAIGLNCVRVPFWYRNFQEDDKGNYYSEGDMDNNPGFQRLDWVIEECRKRGLYVILDLHGAPGFQSKDHCCGKSHDSRLFLDTEEGKYYRELTVELWLRIAKRYKDNPVVAAYDLLNEPMNGYDEIEKKDPVLWDFYDVLYKAIRDIDPEHIISMEGIWEISNLPDPRTYGWDNVLYQTHNYNWQEHEIDQKIREISERAEWNVPVYVGEFQGQGIWEYVLKSYNKAGVSWTTWTYKGVKSTLEGWFISRNIDASLVNPETDSYETILSKWSMIGTDTNGYVTDHDLLEILKKCCIND